MARDHTLYFGRKTETFAILGQFQLGPGGLKFAFDVWPTVEGFDAGDAPIARLRHEFEPGGNFVTDHQQVLNAIRLKLLDILGVAGRNWTIQNFYINTIDKVLTASAISPEGGDVKNESVSGTEYDTMIADNQQLVGGVLSLAWTFAMQNDRFLGATTAA